VEGRRNKWISQSDEEVCVVSVPSNIAEGFMRRHDKEYKQFLYIALGSLAELETQTLLSAELDFLKNEAEEDLRAAMHELNRMITGLIKYL
jgi:four helix bundle protein